MKPKSEQNRPAKFQREGPSLSVIRIDIAEDPDALIGFLLVFFLVNFEFVFFLIVWLFL